MYDSKVQDACLVVQKEVDRAGELGLLTFSRARALALIISRMTLSWQELRSSFGGDIQ